MCMKLDMYLYNTTSCQVELAPLCIELAQLHRFSIVESNELSTYIKRERRRKRESQEGKMKRVN